MEKINLKSKVLPNITILYLEDDLIVRDSIERTLKLVVKNVYTVSNGIEALELIQAGIKIDFVISDIRMPKMDGLSFVEELQKRGLNVPVIITTAFNELEYLTKAIDLKVEKFIQKPVNLKILLEKVTSLSKDLIEKNELRKKRVQLKNYKKAITLTNFVIDYNVQNNITCFSNGLGSYFENKIREQFILMELKQLLEESIFNECMEKINNLDIYNKTLFIKLEGESFSFNITAFASLIEEDKIKIVTFILKDLTQILKEKDETIKKLYTDNLTGLPNRQALYNELNNDNDAELALILINIDDFEKYRHIYGYEVTDKLLNLVKNELEIFWQNTKSKVLYKLDGPNFVITTKKENIENFAEIPEIVDSLLTYLDDYIANIDDISIDISSTIVSSSCSHDDLLLEALIALDVAHRNKKNYQSFITLKSEEKEKYKENIIILQKIKKAFISDGIIPYFQPIVDKDKNIVKYEALARLIDPDEEGKIISPFFFLDLLKDSKHYEKFTKIMIEKSLECSRILNKSVSINLSFEDIINPKIVDFLINTLKENLHQSITIELLESEGIEDITKTTDFCKIMKLYGAKIAIDDFGSGFSNYEYIFDIPIDIIKIDGSLVKRIDDYRGYLVLESIMKLCKNLNIEVVAEFVENEIIFEKLKALGVDMYQGYYISTPKDFKELC